MVFQKNILSTTLFWWITVWWSIPHEHAPRVHDPVNSDWRVATLWVYLPSSYSREIKAVPTGKGSSQLCLRWTHPGENLCTCLHSGSSLYSGWPRSAPPKSQASSSTSSLPSRWLNSGLHSRRGVGTARLHNQKVSVTQSLFHLASGSCFNPHPALI